MVGDMVTPRRLAEALVAVAVQAAVVVLAEDRYGSAVGLAGREEQRVLQVIPVVVVPTRVDVLELEEVRVVAPLALRSMATQKLTGKRWGRSTEAESTK